MTLNKIILPFLFLCSIIFLIGNRVTKINCFLENQACPGELKNNISNLNGSSFFFSNFQQKIAKNQNQETIYLLDSLNKEFPNTITLNFIQEKIEYELIINEEKKYFGISGKSIPQKQDNIKTTIEWKSDNQLFNQDKIDNPYHTKFLKIAQAFSKSSIEKAVVSWQSDSQIIIQIPNQPQFVFDSETIETKVEKIDTIIKARELDEIEEPILEIDMRFNLPVLRTRQ